MKNILYIMLGASIAVSCTKQVDDYKEVVTVDNSKSLTIAQFDSLVEAVEPLNLWDRSQLLQVVRVDGYTITYDTEREKADYLISLIPSGRAGGNVESIVSKSTGNANINGGRSYWDCTPELLASTIAQLGQSCNPKAPNNYHTTGTGATTINLSDVLRAANGLANTSFDNVINIEDVVYVFQLSGDGNWLVDVTMTYNGQAYIFSDALYASGETIDGVTIGYSLIYDPIDGGLNGISIVGPMPGGITEVIGTGDWPTPPVIE